MTNNDVISSIFNKRIALNFRKKEKEKKMITHFLKETVFLQASS